MTTKPTEPVAVVLAVALGLYALGIATLAFYPLEDLTVFEAIIGTAALLAIVGLVARSTRWHLPGERYADLVVGFIGLVALFSYLLEPTAEIGAFRWRTVFLVLTGVVGGFGSYLALDYRGEP